MVWGAPGRPALDGGRDARPVPNFQSHHQPFNYFASYGAWDRGAGEASQRRGIAPHGAEFIKAIDAGKLEQVVFYKPQGNLNEHAGSSAVQAGDAHIADLISHLEKSPQWKNMVVVVTYDENSRLRDHVAPPKGNRWGPGTRIPTPIVISPFAKQGYMDHTQYDTTSIVRFITKRFDLPILPGLAARDAALGANGQLPMGDLTGALTF